MNAEISETMKSTGFGLGMQILAQHKFISAATPTLTFAHNAKTFLRLSITIYTPKMVKIRQFVKKLLVNKE